ncbi:MAG: DUF1176 domain-containing protein [Parvibaculaceae bacterium]
MRSTIKRPSIMRRFLLSALALLAATPSLADFTAEPLAPPPADVIARATDDPDCFLPDGIDKGNMWEAATLDASTRVHLVPCQLAAYNMVSKVLLERRDGESDTSTWDTLSFARYSDALGWSASDTLVNASIDGSTGQLTEFAKGRGVGDCGSFATWEWTGYAFAMVEYAYEGDCRGRLPGDWPVIFRRTAAPETPGD